MRVTKEQSSPLHSSPTLEKLPPLAEQTPAERARTRRSVLPSLRRVFALVIPLLLAPKSAEAPQANATTASLKSTELPDLTPPIKEDQLPLNAPSARVTFSHQGQEYTYDREDLEDKLMSGFRKELSDLADHCADAEQCFYYYGDQLEVNLSALSALTGKTEAELSWTAAALQEGFLQPSGIRFEGTHTRAVERGRIQLNFLSPEQQTDFYQELYITNRDTLQTLYQDFNLVQRLPEEQNRLRRKAAQLLTARTEEALKYAEVRYGAATYKDFEQWWTEGVARGELPSGEAKWQKAQGASVQALIELYRSAVENQPASKRQRLTATQKQTQLEAQQDYHLSRYEIFVAQRNSAAQNWLRQDEAQRWTARAKQELQQIRTLTAQLEVLDAQNLAALTKD